MASEGSLGNALLGVPVVNCVSLLRLLHAVDCIPRGGLYGGYYALAAAARYESIWLKALALNQRAFVPPLDVAFAWFVHRQDPAGFRRVCSDYQAYIHPDAQLAFAFDATRCRKVSWKAVAGENPVWPPPAPGGPYDPLAEGNSKFAVQLAGSMSYFSRLLHSWLRPYFLDVNFLTRAQQRYGRFLSLHADHPYMLLVPPADVALMWHTHLGLSGEYAAACEALFGADAPPWRPDYLDLSPENLGEAYKLTATVYIEKYGEPFDDPDTAWLPHTVPYPLAAPDSPIGWALRVFDENPLQDYQRPALMSVVARTGYALVDMPVVRSGAHALFAAWLAAQRAQCAYEKAMHCSCCFPTSMDAVDLITLKHALAALVSITYFLELPDRDTHPYIAAIKLRGDLLSPSVTEATVGTTNASGPLAVASGFSPSDPARYLWGPESSNLLGLAAQLAAGDKPEPGEQDNQLWTLLSKQGMREVAEKRLHDARQYAAAFGVGDMQEKNKRCRDTNYSCVVYKTTDYYNSEKLKTSLGDAGVRDGGFGTYSL